MKFLLAISALGLGFAAQAATLTCGSGKAGDEASDQSVLVDNARPILKMANDSAAAEISAAVYPGGHGELYSIVIEAKNTSDGSSLLYSKIITVEGRPQDIVVHSDKGNALSINCKITK